MNQDMLTIIKTDRQTTKQIKTEPYVTRNNRAMYAQLTSS
jgi:hypothetical protein